MGRRKHESLVIRGETFPTVQAAARAHDVTEGAVYHAIRNGTLDLVGLGCGPAPLPVCIRGEVYPDANAAARAMGVTTGAIRQALRRGRIDRVGLRSTRVPPNAVPFRIGRLEFPSMRAASIALGFPPEFISRAVSRGQASSMQAVLGAAMRYSRKREMAR